MIIIGVGKKKSLSLPLYSQMVIEGVRGPGIEGDVAIDDVTIEEGECKDPPPNSKLSGCCCQCSPPRESPTPTSTQP